MKKAAWAIVFAWAAVAVVVSCLSLWDGRVTVGVDCPPHLHHVAPLAMVDLAHCVATPAEKLRAARVARAAASFRESAHVEVSPEAALLAAERCVALQERLGLPDDTCEKAKRIYFPGGADPA